MSLVVAAHNRDKIVIAFDDLSRSTKTGSFEPDSSVEKVKRINSKLAYMMTGGFMSDKLQFIKDYAQQTRSTTQLDTAFWSLFNLAKSKMVVYPSEGFRLGLAGFNGAIPGFKCITVVYGQEIVPEGANVNYYISGEDNPAILSEERIKTSDILKKPSADQIAHILKQIVQDCIAAYPETLGEPV